MDYLIKGLFTLIGLIIAVLLLNIVCNSFYLFPFIKIEYLRLLPGILIGCGVVIAILNFMREKQYKRDEIHLEIIKDSLNKFFEHLENLNNNRIIWIHAARLIIQVDNLIEKIENPEIKESSKLLREEVRIKLRLKLSLPMNNEGNNTLGRKSLPLAFFYGLHNWTEKAEWSYVECFKKAQRVSDDSSKAPTYSTMLDPFSVISIYNFLKLPENYFKVFDEVEKLGDDYKIGIGSGAKNYIDSYPKIENKKVPNKKWWNRVFS